MGALLAVLALLVLIVLIMVGLVAALVVFLYFATGRSAEKAKGREASGSGEHGEVAAGRSA